MTGFKAPELKPIGIAHTPFARPEDVERPGAARGSIEVFKRYAQGLKDIEGFSHIIVIWLFHIVMGAPKINPTKSRSAVVGNLAKLLPGPS